MGKPRELGSPIKRREKGSLVLSNLRKPHLLCKSYRFNDRSEFIQKGHKLGKQWIFTYFFQIEKKCISKTSEFIRILFHTFVIISVWSRTFHKNVILEWIWSSHEIPSMAHIPWLHMLWEFDGYQIYPKIHLKMQNMGHLWMFQYYFHNITIQNYQIFEILLISLCFRIFNDASFNKLDSHYENSKSFRYF